MLRRDIALAKTYKERAYLRLVDLKPVTEGSNLSFILLRFLLQLSGNYFR